MAEIRKKVYVGSIAVGSSHGLNWILLLQLARGRTHFDNVYQTSKTKSETMHSRVLPGFWLPAPTAYVKLDPLLVMIDPTNYGGGV